MARPPLPFTRAPLTRPAFTRPAFTRAALIGVGLSLSLLTACGSALAPDDMVSAGAGTTGSDIAAAPMVGQVEADGAATQDQAGDVAPGSVSQRGANPSADQTESNDRPADTATGPSRSKASSDCSAIPDQIGITPTTITVANVSDIGGPVPGVFQSAQDAANAFAAYINSEGGICGRQLKILQLDSRADSGANQVAYARACNEAFAAVGSMSVFDQGAATAGECGLPDIHAVTVSQQAFECETCFGAAAINPDLQLGAMAQYVLDTYGADAQKAAVLYVNVNGVADAAKVLATAWKKVGVGVQYVQAMEVAEFNYAPYVQRLQEQGIKIVHYIGPYQFTVRLQQAMQQQDYHPTAFIQDQTIYSKEYVDTAGDLGNGTIVYGATDLFTNRANAEMQRYVSWLQQARPGADPTPYGVFSWSAARLFADLVTQLGSQLSRSSLVQALRKTGDWTGHGVTSPQDIGDKITGKCIKVIQLESGTWKKLSPGDYVCAPLVPTH